MKTALIAAGIALLFPAAALAQTDDAPAAAPVGAHYTLATPIKDLIADPAARAVLDKDLPGMSSDENLPKFEDKSLRQLQPMSGGQLTDDLMKQVEGDLAALGGGSATTDDAPVRGDAAPSDDTTTKDTAPVGSSTAPVGR